VYNRAMLALCLAVLSLPTAQDPSVETLVQRVQAYYDQMGGFEADFTQRYERRLLRRVVEESGRVVVKKPGRMRWEYETPEEKLFVTDGTRSYFYLPLERQVMVSHQPEGAMGLDEGSPFELLAGRARMTDSFAFFESEEEPTHGGVMLHLIPTEHHDEFETVELEVDPDSGTMHRVVLIDSGRNRTEFIFENLHRNEELPESLFRFTVPSGVEVVLHADTPPDPR